MSLIAIVLGLYAALTGLMLVAGLVTVITFHRWEQAVLFGETVVLGSFRVFWLVQSFELWNRGPSRLVVDRRLCPVSREELREGRSWRDMARHGSRFRRDSDLTFG